jgi:agmatine deiminase
MPGKPLKKELAGLMNDVKIYMVSKEKNMKQLSTNVVVNRSAIADWGKVDTLVLVYPQKLYRRNHLTKFYDKFINTLPNDLKIILLVKNEKIAELIHKQFFNRNIHTHIFEDINDIWIKDYAPLCIFYGELRQTSKFLYNPRYFQGDEKKYADLDHNVGKQLGKLLNAPTFLETDIIWDLGNLTHNGNGTAIISNRLISDNEHISIDQLKNLLYLFCGFSRTIFVPVEPGDETGHVDGMVRFINEKTLLVGAYPEHYKEAPFMDRLANDLQVQLGNEYQIIRLFNSEPLNEGKEGLASAIGNHVNFLRIEDSIYFPYYSDEISGKALDHFTSELSKFQLNIKVIPVNMPEINELARLGGVLNCMTWQLLQ